MESIPLIVEEKLEKATISQCAEENNKREKKVNA
jgi:hypothetical protein